MELERMTILRMVADGKITPDEGAQLLDALRDSVREPDAGRTSDPSRPEDMRHPSREARQRAREERHRAHEERRRGHQHNREHRRETGRWGGALFENMFPNGLFAGGIFGSAEGGSHAPGEDESKPTYDIPEGSTITIACHAGNLTIRGTDTGTLRVSSQGRKFPFGLFQPRVRVDQETKHVEIVSDIQSLTVEVPWQAVTVEAHMEAGNLDIADVTASLNLHVEAGNVRVQDVSGVIRARISAGNAEFSMIQGPDLDIHVEGGALAVALDTLTQGTVALRTAAGNLVFQVPDSSAFEVDARTDAGQIYANLPEQSSTHERDGITEHLRYIHHEGGATIRLVAEVGNIELNLIDTADTQRLQTEEGALA